MFEISLKENLKIKIKNNSRLYKFLNFSMFIYKSHWWNQNKKIYPQILQFPITNKCNSKCVMCNVHKLNSNNEMTTADFEKVINDNLFKDIKAVGINGGEPFLFPYLIDFVKLLLKKESLASLNMISNGFLSEHILSRTKEIYNLCKERNVSFHISFSLDGYEGTHDRVRGVKGAFEKSIYTIKKIKENRALYCDGYDIGCTVVKQNVDFLQELDCFMKANNLPVKYRLGIENNRLHNTNRSSYSVLDNQGSKQSAAEFFYAKIFQSKDVYEKFKYYSIFSFLVEDNPKRKLGCNWKEKGVTLDSFGNIYYCAVKSPCIANLRQQNGEEAFFSKKSLEIRKNIIKQDCNDCIHDYYGEPKLKDVVSFFKFIYKNRFWINQYRR